jgi:hypothetical protein
MFTKYSLVSMSVAALSVFGGSAASAASPETMFLDAHEVQASGDEFAGPVASNQLFGPGNVITVKVSGTVSLWANRSWYNGRFTVCGVPRSLPEFPTFAVTNSYTGVDADGRFATVQVPATCPALPAPFDNFQVSTDAGVTWAKPQWTPLAGANTTTHEYSFLVLGNNKGIRARFYDPAAYDNYGQFKIDMTPAVVIP